MQQKSLKRTLTAAMLTLVVTAAYAQDYPLTAKIPFAFRAVGSDLAAGQYELEHMTGNSRTIVLRNTDTGKAVFIQSKAPISESKEAGPRLIFQCRGDAGCSLATLWSGTGTGLEFTTPALTAAQRERGATLLLVRLK